MDRQYASGHTPHHPHHHPFDGPSSQRPTPQTTPGAMPGLPPPPTAQPPVQMSYADPFHNRDPFIPASHHRREKSYGSILSGGPTPNGERAWSTVAGPVQQPPPLQHAAYPPPNHHHNDPGPPPASWTHARRRSLGGALSPPRYRGHIEQPSAPPPFAPRNMPPPSPSSSTAPSFPTSTARPTPTSHYRTQHDSTPTSSRSNGGMSITSLIGHDRPVSTDRTPQAATTQNSPTLKTGNILSPKRARSTSVRSEHGHYPRPLSPRASIHGFYRDDRDRNAAPRHDYGPPIPPPSSAPSFRPYRSSPTADQFPAGMSRPTSQPSSAAQSQAPETWRPAHGESRTVGGFREYAPSHAEPPRQATEDNRYGPQHLDKARFFDERSAPSTTYYGRAPHNERDLHHEQRYQTIDHRTAAAERGYSDSQPFYRRASPPTSVDKTDGTESRFRHYPEPLVDQERDGRSTPHLARKDEHGNPMARSYLTISPEVNRKGGRSSPLPQAVQGAQPQLSGPGRDPSIKNEFGRMFSGLGSGVGGSGTPNGPFSAAGNLTPSRLSPSRFVDRDSSPLAEGETIVDGPSLLHPDSRHEVHDIGTPEDLDGRGTPVLQNGNKRLKTSHPAHHHHHHGHVHGHAHHHHHHHHTAPEDGSVKGNGTNAVRLPHNSSGTPEATAKVGHHHHHHHAAGHNHPPHHHHHTALQGASRPPPEIIVRNGDILETAAQSPRAHLGSALYSTTLALPANKRTHLVDTKFFFDSTPTAIPYFERRENCTFTVRVPREYLQSMSEMPFTNSIDGGLEEICRRRAVWGTDIYTDDSDVVAAAVHAGWIKGAFGTETERDADRLFPPEKDKHDALPTATMHAQRDPAVIREKPAAPVVVPRDRDMHVTVLLLPPLLQYAASTRHFLRSRPWGADHDGMSYMVHAIDFVDEPEPSRFQARGPGARKERLRGELVRRREAADALLGLGKGVSVGA